VIPAPVPARSKKTRREQALLVDASEEFGLKEQALVPHRQTDSLPTGPSCGKMTLGVLAVEEAPEF
jgi:hypothetical protein